MAVINELLIMQQYFKTGVTKPYEFRKMQLLKLRESILSHQDTIAAALYKDLKKSAEESWISETGFLLAEITYTLANLKTWMKAESI